MDFTEPERLGDLLAWQWERKLCVRWLLMCLWSVLLAAWGCSLGPRTVDNGRLQFNEAVKTTSEQQLLLNIVRLRYTDSPSSSWLFRRLRIKESWWEALG